MEGSADSSNRNIINKKRKTKRAALQQFFAWFKRVKKEGNFEQTELDKRLVYSFSKKRIPSLKQLRYLKKFLSRRELWLMRGCFSIIFLSFIFLATNFYLTHRQVVPVRGGEYIEGIIGAPQNINPLYASLNDADNDLSRLIFSSLFKRTLTGRLEGDLVESYEISEDGKTFTLKIRDKVKWHSGSLLTPDDVIFTFNAIKDIGYKSPLRSSFGGVELEKVADSTIKFTLKESYADFLDLLTFGILPQEFWSQITPPAARLAELNLKPIGSGPYKFKSLVKDKNGNLKLYNLVANSDYYAAEPKIEEIKFQFFPVIEEALAALNENSIDGLNYLPKQYKEKLVAKDALNIYPLELPQLMAIFFNQKNNSAFAEKKVRQALALAVDKQAIIQNTLNGDARIIDGPIPPESFFYYGQVKKYDYNQAEANKLFDEAGWSVKEISQAEIDQANQDKESEKEKDRQVAEEIIALGAGQWRQKDGKYLKIKLTAADKEESAGVAEAIKDYWQKVNVKAEIELVSAASIQADTVKTRQFEALFYGEVVGIYPDVYTFWHSSQSGLNGLNIADYSNKDVDKLLEDGRLSVNEEERRDIYKKFQEIIAEDEPAIFIYSPFYYYVQSKKVKGFATKNINVPSNRFDNLTDWYVKTGKKLIW